MVITENEFLIKTFFKFSAYILPLYLIGGLIYHLVFNIENTMYPNLTGTLMFFIIAVASLLPIYVIRSLITFNGLVSIEDTFTNFMFYLITLIFSPMCCLMSEIFIRHLILFPALISIMEVVIWWSLTIVGISIGLCMIGLIFVVSIENVRNIYSLTDIINKQDNKLHEVVT